MSVEKYNQANTKKGFHSRSKHNNRYDFKLLIQSCPQLEAFIILTKHNNESIDFSDPIAVRMLNYALLKYYYNIEYWDIPKNYLCPAVPGRADYIHHIADILSGSNNNITPKGKKIRCFDIGVGASCIYPIIGIKEYGWSFMGSDIDPKAIESANKIIELNPSLKDHIELRTQINPRDIFKGVIREKEQYDVILCNPPFHASAEEAKSASLRKLSNLKRKKVTVTKLNFGGQNSELWYEGGEKAFVSQMIHESTSYAESCFCFTTLISKESNLPFLYKKLKQYNIAESKTISLDQGNKKSRIVSWTFLDKNAKKLWVESRWR